MLVQQDTHATQSESLLLPLSRDSTISIIPGRGCRLRSSVLVYFLIYRARKGWILQYHGTPAWFMNATSQRCTIHTRRRECGNGCPRIVPIITPHYDNFSFFFFFGDNESMMIGDVSMMIGSTVHMKSPTAFPSQSASAPLIPKSIELTTPGREISSGW
jgi:hypothetical protein